MWGVVNSLRSFSFLFFLRSLEEGTGQSCLRLAEVHVTMIGAVVRILQNKIHCRGTLTLKHFLLLVC